MNISEERLNHLEDRSKELTQAQIDGNRMRLHLHALTVFVNTGGDNFDELAAQFPRTWNAILTNNPTSWDLPSFSGDWRDHYSAFNTKG